ncbi:GDSL esterase/lipase [Panicum miliaceum]|uniref:GDSL esterase/lipase n=1 Tax=Panicum miliaceum TaxID=4540 RepID=A0A3L6TH03_PANMI|nr:GDSL esterase/lipase [Panicum miliaceum]
MKLFAAACFVVVLLNIAGRVAEARAVAGDVATQQRRHHRHLRRHHHHLPRAKRAHKLFVFGDDFADNGNSASDPGLGSVSRAWRYPFGMSDAAHGRKATGRFSDGLNLKDLVAKVVDELASVGGYCGRDGGYSLCTRPEEYFFWDVVHPTHAGWRAVMQLLQGPIMAFLGISDLEHF